MEEKKKYICPIIQITSFSEDLNVKMNTSTVSYPWSVDDDFEREDDWR